MLNFIQRDTQMKWLGKQRMINKNQPHASRAQRDSIPSPCCKREAVERAHQRTAVERERYWEGWHAYEGRQQKYCKVRYCGETCTDARLKPCCGAVVTERPKDMYTHTTAHMCMCSMKSLPAPTEDQRAQCLWFTDVLIIYQKKTRINQ